MTFTVVNKPSYVTVTGGGTDSITVSAESVDRFDAGTITIDVLANSIEYAHTAATFTTLTFTLVDPCLTTVFQTTQTLADMFTTVLRSTAETQQLDETLVKDSISLASGDGSGTDYCHERTYSIASVPNSASTQIPADQLTVSANGLISLQVDSKDYLGTHTATLTMSGLGASETPVTLSFTITIDGCLITSFIQSAPPSNQNYIIGDVALTWSYDENFAIQVPLCEYDYTF